MMYINNEDTLRVHCYTQLYEALRDNIGFGNTKDLFRVGVNTSKGYVVGSFRGSDSLPNVY